MPDIVPEQKAETSRIKAALRWVVYLLASAGFTAISVFVAILRNSGWHNSLLHFLSRSWQSFVSSMSTNTLGFVMASILIPVIGAAATLGGLFVFKKREDFWQALRESLVVGAFVTVAMLCLWSAMFGRNAARVVYDDHQNMTNEARILASKNDSLTSQSKRLQNDLLDCQKVKCAEAQAEAKAKRAAIRKQLGDFLLQAEGMKLQCEHWQQGNPPSKKDAIAWTKQVISYLKNNLDSAYANQFLTAQPEGIDSAIRPVGMPDEVLGVWQGLTVRKELLNKFIDGLKD